MKYAFVEDDRTVTQAVPRARNGNEEENSVEMRAKPNVSLLYPVRKR